MQHSVFQFGASLQSSQDHCILLTLVTALHQWEVLGVTNISDHHAMTVCDTPIWYTHLPNVHTNSNTILMETLFNNFAVFDVQSILQESNYFFLDFRVEENQLFVGPNC